MAEPPPPSPGGDDDGSKDAAIAKIEEQVTPFLLVNSGSQETIADEGLGSKPSSGREIEILRGDTLWGHSHKYGVSINAIKEANGIQGDTIYAGKKLIIP
ncbi:unnamed protein product [Musa textilis]